MLKVAITGNIAAGKSEVEKLLAKDFPVYDADKIAHKFLPQGVNRKELGKKVFADPELRKQLEDEIHPKVKAEILEILTPSLRERVGERGQSNVIFISVPLLFEANFDTMFDKILFVATDDNIRLKRLMARNNLSQDEALQRMNAQMSQEEKIEKSDYVIYNNSTLEELENQVSIFVVELHRLIHLKNAQQEK